MSNSERSWSNSGVLDHSPLFLPYSLRGGRSERRADAREGLGAGLVGAEDHKVGDLHVLRSRRSVQHIVGHVGSHLIRVRVGGRIRVRIRVRDMVRG